MRFFITIIQDEDGMFIAECPSIPGCISQGKTLKEAEKNIQKAIKECLEVRAQSPGSGEGNTKGFDIASRIDN